MMSISAIRKLVSQDPLEAGDRIIRLQAALRAIRDFDAFQGGPIAPRENPTTQRMRRIAAEALKDEV